MDNDKPKKRRPYNPDYKIPNLSDPVLLVKEKIVEQDDQFQEIEVERIDISKST